MSANGTTSFYKDGYTDLRGKFDYATKSMGAIDGLKRFALLVMSQELGKLREEPCA